MTKGERTLDNPKEVTSTRLCDFDTEWTVRLWVKEDLEYLNIKTREG